MGLPGRSKTGFGRLDPSEREEVPVPISDLPKIPMENPPDYKKTLNLPRTEFPMKANLPQREPERLSWWKDQRIYERLLEKNRNCPPFRFHDGPPYANGHIHQGHMLNRILKDIVLKSRSMAGRYVDFIPGWDCHGLPIELQVDRRLGPKKREMTRNQIRDACRAYAEEWIEVQRQEFRRLGVFGRWEQPYLTMDYAYEAATVRELAKFAASGGLYRGKKPVFWCIHDRTALAEAEVEYDDHVSPSIWVAMDAVGPVEGVGERVRLVIWTTTPWTLPANLAIAVHPDFEYVGYRLDDSVLVLAKERLVPFLKEVFPDHLRDGEPDPARIVATVSGRSLEGLRYRHPFLDRESPVILGEHVTLEQGSGLVHTAPGHGQEDYEVGLVYGLPILNPVDDGGYFTAEAGAELSGQRIFDANPRIVEMLRASGHLLKDGQIQHSYPHCWRCSNPVVFRATSQWFISMEANDLRKIALEEVDRVQWIPRWGRERIRGMLENRPDWCISRQRAWGTPIPIVFCEDCGEPLVSAELMNRVADFIEKEGGNTWFERPVEDFLPEGTRCACGGTRFRKEEDILDVWFDSGVSFAAVLEPRLGLPADLYLEGSDQHRGWFHSSLLCSVGTRGHAPYRAVLTHGFVVDGEGRKLSKRLGNYIDPHKLIAQYGAEIVRLWVASEDFRGDIRSSPEIFRQLGEAYFRIRNTLRYCLSNLYDFDPAKDAVPTEKLPALERWVDGRRGAFVSKVRRAYDDYEFHLVYKAALDFCANEVSAILADIRKDVLYCDRPDSHARRSTQTVLYRIARDLCLCLAPILSFTMEEAWSHLPGTREDSVFLAELPEPDSVDAELEARFEKLLAVRSAVARELEAERREKRIGKSLEAKVVLGAEGELHALLEEAKDELAAFLIVSQVELRKGGSEGTRAEGIDLFVKVLPAAGEKCVRCWIYYEDLGVDPAHPQLCRRCADAVAAST